MTPPCHDDYVLSEQVIAALAAVEALAATDIGGCDRDDLDVVLTRWRTVRSFADAIELAVARRCRELAAEGRSACAEDVLAQGGRRSAKDARAAAAREHACTKVSGFEQALADGRVSVGHIDAFGGGHPRARRRRYCCVRRPRRCAASAGGARIGGDVHAQLPGLGTHRLLGRRRVTTGASTQGEPDPPVGRPCDGHASPSRRARP